jgi:hypothetical protein
MDTAILKNREMKKMVLDVKIDKYSFFVELIKNFDFVHIAPEDSGDSKEDVISNLTRGFNDLKLYKQGKLKTTTAKEFLNEL